MEDVSSVLLTSGNALTPRDRKRRSRTQDPKTGPASSLQIKSRDSILIMWPVSPTGGGTFWNPWTNRSLHVLYRSTQALGDQGHLICLGK